jgi:hypothetical protein
MTKLRTNKSTIKNDPFATVIPLSVEAEVEPPRVEPEIVQEPIREVAEKPKIANEDRQRRATPANSIRVAQTTRQKLTVHLESSLAERVKNAAYWNPKLTIAGIAEQGIRLAIEKHEREHGGKYPPREGELVGGRPIK